MFYVFCFYFMLFIIYSFIGWCIEVIGKLIEKHRFIDRGFLVGPICPIYGWGCIFIILFLDKYKYSLLVLFCMAIVICSILEYLTSYVMEKMFNVRWWDYTKNKFNINGRICAETMIPFGILGCMMIYVINPFFSKFLLRVNPNVLIILSIIIFIIYIGDTILSFNIMFGFKNTLKTLERDGTEEITKRVKEILRSKSFLYRRLVNAFPTLWSRRERLLYLEEQIKRDLSRIIGK